MRRWGSEGPTFKEQQHQMTVCPKYEKEIQVASLNQHLKFVHHVQRADIEKSVNRAEMNSWPSEALGINAEMGDFPKVGCPYVGNNNYQLRRHLRAMHPNDTITSSNQQLSQCQNCRIYLLRRITPKHRRTQYCKRMTERNGMLFLRSAHEVLQTTDFRVSGTAVESVPSFKYLGRQLTNTNDDWLAVCYNIKKAKTQWGRVRRILKLETSSTRVMGNFYKAVVQSVLLFGAETWVLPNTMLRKLEAFHNQVARHIDRDFIRPDLVIEGEWICPPQRKC